MDPIAAYTKKRERLIAELAAARSQGASIALGKPTTNLFRQRDQRRSKKVDVRLFNQVLRIDSQNRLADVEGMTTYSAFVDATLPHGLLPAVVPQLKTITVGGAVSGLGIESSSFQFGLVHETVEEMEILLGDGRVVVCSPAQNQDLFYGFPNSYGTLGYVLRLRVRLIPASKYVYLRHTRFLEPKTYFAAISEVCESDGFDYVDGTIFGTDEMYLTTGEFSADAPHVSDYTYMGIYYKSIGRRKEDWLTAKSYIWRWDTDWFWCSKQFYAQNPVVRFLATKWALNSRTYQRIMRLSYTLLPEWNGRESVIQDVDIPIENAAEFFDFLLTEIGITPVWVCPFRAGGGYDLCPLEPGKFYINFGFWDVVATTHENGYLNRKVECKALDLKGQKGLYSTAYYDRETFWQIYDKRRYDELKRKYDSNRVFQDLYAKCVERK